MTSPIADQRGYTLIELLVAMLLLSMIGLVVAGGIQFGSRVWERSESRIAQSQNTEGAQQIVRQILAAAVPHLSGGLTSFGGEPQRMAFDAPAPAAVEHPGITHFVLSAVPSQDGEHLVLRAEADGHARGATLASRVHFHFDYLDSSGDVPVWLAVWRNRSRLPDAVRITAEAWPDLIVRPAIAQDAMCAFDTVSAACRLR